MNQHIKELILTERSDIFADGNWETVFRNIESSDYERHPYGLEILSKNKQERTLIPWSRIYSLRTVEQAPNLSKDIEQATNTLKTKRV